MDDTCLEDSLMQPADQTQSENAAVSAESQGDGTDIPKPSGALAALVKVQIKYMFSICFYKQGFDIFQYNDDLSINKKR